MVKSNIVALALVGVVACVGLVQANSHHHDLDLGHGIGGELHGHGDFGLGGSLEHEHRLGLGHNHGLGHEHELGHRLGKQHLGLGHGHGHGIRQQHQLGHGLLNKHQGLFRGQPLKGGFRSQRPGIRGGFRNKHGAGAGLKSDTHLGNHQHLQGSQGSLLGAGGRIVNEHDHDTHFNDNHLHAQGGRNKNREIVKESDNSFGSVDADSVNIGNRDHKLQGAEAGIIGAQGSQGSLDNKQTLDNEFGAGAAIGSDKSGFGELNL